MRKMRTNDVMRNMVTGNVATIAAVKGENVTFDNGDTLPAAVVNNCFSFIENESPYEAPQAVVNENELFVDGEKVVTGIMKLEKVLFTVPAQVYILVENKDKKKDIVRYDVRTEKFDNIHVGFDRVEILYNQEGILIYSVVTETDRQVAGEAEDEKATVKEYSDKVYILKEGCSIGELYNMALDKFVKEIKTDNGVLVFFERNKALNTKDDLDGYEFITPVDMDGIDLVEIKVYEEKDEDGEVTGVYADAFENHYGNVRAISKVHGSEQVMVVTDSGIHIFGRRHMAIGQDVLDAVEKYPILCRFTAAKDSHRHDTFVLANSSYESVTIRVKRVGGPVGYVTEISKN